MSRIQMISVAYSGQTVLINLRQLSYRAARRREYLCSVKGNDLQHCLAKCLRYHEGFIKKAYGYRLRRLRSRKFKVEALFYRKEKPRSD